MGKKGTEQEGRAHGFFSSFFLLMYGSVFRFTGGADVLLVDTLWLFVLGEDSRRDGQKGGGRVRQEEGRFGRCPTYAARALRIPPYVPAADEQTGQDVIHFLH